MASHSGGHMGPYHPCMVCIPMNTCMDVNLVGRYRYEYGMNMAWIWLNMYIYIYISIYLSVYLSIYLYTFDIVTKIDKARNQHLNHVESMEVLCDSCRLRRSWEEMGGGRRYGIPRKRVTVWEKCGDPVGGKAETKTTNKNHVTSLESSKFDGRRCLISKLRIENGDFP